MKTSKYDGLTDYRDIIDIKEKVILAIGLMFVSKYDDAYVGTGSLIAIDIPFLNSDGNKIGSHKCFFILTCAHNVVYKEDDTDKYYRMANGITIFLHAFA